MGVGVAAAAIHIAAGFNVWGRRARQVEDVLVAAVTQCPVVGLCIVKDIGDAKFAPKIPVGHVCKLKVFDEIGLN